jgi:DHA1 family tetracycline resistance protein-like MFS transporter
MIFTIVAVASIGAISQPAGQAMITKEVQPTEQGAVQGALASLQSLAGILGPLIGGFTLNYFIEHPMRDWPFRLDGANFYASAVLAALGWVAAAWAVRHHRESG